MLHGSFFRCLENHGLLFYTATSTVFFLSSPDTHYKYQMQVSHCCHENVKGGVYDIQYRGYTGACSLRSAELQSAQAEDLLFPEMLAAILSSVLDFSSAIHDSMRDASRGTKRTSKGFGVELRPLGLAQAVAGLMS